MFGTIVIIFVLMLICAIVTGTIIRVAKLEDKFARLDGILANHLALDPRYTTAKENIELALANDPRTATPEEASEAYMQLTAMIDHRGDGIPTQYVHGHQVAELSQILWTALVTQLRENSRAQSTH